MNRKFVWIGAGVFFVIAVGSGFIPDLRLGSELRKARQSGLTVLAHPDVKPKYEDNAATAYRQAISKFGPIPNYLVQDFAAQIKSNRPQLRRYIEAMNEASKRPAFSVAGSEDGADQGYSMPLGATIFNAARAGVALATDTDQLEGPARMAKHLGSQGTALEVGQWAHVVNAIFNRAKVLHLSEPEQARIAGLLGPSPSAWQALHDHVARKILAMEERAKRDGRRSGRVRDEAAYLQFWREFFAENPPDRPIVQAVKAKEDLIEEADQRNGEYTDFEGLFGTSGTPWTDWAKLVDGASLRLAIAR